MLAPSGLPTEDTRSVGLPTEDARSVGLADGGYSLRRLTARGAKHPAGWYPRRLVADGGAATGRCDDRQVVDRRVPYEPLVEQLEADEAALARHRDRV
jgi:hypothetical protein